MRRTVILVTAASLALASCGWRDSRLNPGNWFGNSREVVLEGEPAEVNPLIPPRRATGKREEEDRHVPIATVSDLKIERTPSGAIIYAEGVAATQGAYSAELRPVNPDEPVSDGVLLYEFVVVYPRDQRAVGTERTRTVTVARTVSTQDLNEVSVIRVTAASNARESRRR